MEQIFTTARLLPQVFIRMRSTAVLFFTFCLGLAWSQAQTPREVTVRISVPGNQELLVDTSFFVYEDVNIDSVLAQLNQGRWGENQGLNKLIVIREPDQKADVARSRPDRNGPKPMLGLYLDSDYHERDGVKLTGVFGSAQDAGLRTGDLVIAIDGEPVYDVEDIGYAKNNRSVGDVLEVTVQREGEERTFGVTLSGETSPAQTARTTVHRPKRKGFMGVYTDEVDRELADRLGMDSQLGVYLKQVVPGSGAERAGLRGGDILIQVGGRDLDAAWELSDALEGFEPGDQVQVQYLRDGQKATSTVELTEKIDHHPKPTRWKQVKMEQAYLGVHLEGEGTGVRITRIVEDEAAEAAGLQVGDRILSLDDERVENYDQLAKAIRSREPGDQVRLQVLREATERSVRATLGSRMQHHWVMISPDLDREVEDVLDDMEDPAQAETLRDQYNSPSLDMEDFEFFPNPNSGQFRLRFTLPERGNTDIRVFSPEGKEVYRERLRNFSGSFDQRIDLGQDLPRGVYFLQVTRNGKGMVERFILQ